MEKMERLKKMLCKELEEITQAGSITLGDLDAIYKLVVAIEKIDRIEEIEGDEYSRDGGWMARGDYSRSRGLSDDSFRNDSYGSRHYVRGHYSRAGENMGEVIEEMMSSPNTSLKDKETLRKAMEILGR